LAAKAVEEVESGSAGRHDHLMPESGGV